MPAHRFNPQTSSERRWTKPSPSCGDARRRCWCVAKSGFRGGGRKNRPSATAVKRHPISVAGVARGLLVALFACWRGPSHRVQFAASGRTTTSARARAGSNSRPRAPLSTRGAQPWAHVIVDGQRPRPRRRATDSALRRHPLRAPRAPPSPHRAAHGRASPRRDRPARREHEGAAAGNRDSREKSRPTGLHPRTSGFVTVTLRKASGRPARTRWWNADVLAQGRELWHQFAGSPPVPHNGPGGDPDGGSCRSYRHLGPVKIMEVELRSGRGSPLRTARGARRRRNGDRVDRSRGERRRRSSGRAQGHVAGARPAAGLSHHVPGGGPVVRSIEHPNVVRRARGRRRSRHAIHGDGVGPWGFPEDHHP